MDRIYEIKYLPVAQQDITELIEYIKSDNPKAAFLFLDKIDKTISRLAYFPYSGSIPKDNRLKALNYRLLVIDNYLVFYVVMNDFIEIRRILHGKRKYNFIY